MEGILEDLLCLFCTLVPEGSFTGGPIDHLLYFPKIWGFDFTLLLTDFSQDCKLHPCMIIAAQEIHGGAPLSSLNKCQLFAV